MATSRHERDRCGSRGRAPVRRGDRPRAARRAGRGCRRRRASAGGGDPPADAGATAEVIREALRDAGLDATASRCRTPRRPRPRRCRVLLERARPDRASPARRGDRARRRLGHRPRRLRRRHLDARGRWSPCRPRCSAWWTPPSAARPGSTPTAGKNMVGAFYEPAGGDRRPGRPWRRCRSPSCVAGWPRWSSAASSPTRRS